MRRRTAFALIVLAPIVGACAPNPMTETAPAWECTATAENNLGADRLYSRHDADRTVAVNKALESCRQHDSNPEMCRVVVADCQPY